MSGLTHAAAASGVTLPIAESDVTGLVADLAAKAPAASPTFTGTVTLPSGLVLPAGVTAPTQAASDNSTKVATTAYADAAVAVEASARSTAVALKANLASPTFTGTPSLPTGTTGTTQAADDNSTKLATTAYADAIKALKANLASPALTGHPTGVTESPGDNSTRLASTAYADAIAALKANIASPTLTGTPAAPTPSADDNSTKIATTAYIDRIGLKGVWDPSQYGFIAASMLLDAAVQSQTAVLTSGRVYAQRCVVRAAAASGTRTVVVGIQTAGGTLTSGQSLIAVYNSSGTQLGSTSADQSVNWATAGVYQATVGTFAVALGDVIYIMVLSVGTTPPKFYGSPSAAVPLLNLNLAAATLRFSVQASSQTAMPAGITPANLLGNNGSAIWVALI